ncbi:hypothetical protein [Candidatus Solincola sp.]|nr:hypothetical protein [Actinomycetota bacterium]MDI7253244.1 hypothetical protein [Actinomycetota bacterium]
MEERYRTPAGRKRNLLAEEMGKFSICYALSEHASAEGNDRRGETFSGLEVQGIKEGIFREILREGDTVEAEGMLSPYAAIYQPRAYYPAYVMGEMRAALRRGEPPPQASPHYLPVSRLPELPDGRRIGFLYSPRKKDFDRPDFPAHVRDVLTRDFPRLPVLLHAGDHGNWGLVRLRARLLRLEREAMRRLAGMGEEAYTAYAARGLVHFLEPLEMERVQPLPMRGSLFAEISFSGGTSWERTCGALDVILRETVEEVFPPCERGERQEGTYCLPHSGHHVFRFRSRLFALVYHPAIAVFRAPGLLGLFLPANLGGGEDEPHELFQRLAEGVAERILADSGVASGCKVEVAYDNRLPWVREWGVLAGPDFTALSEEYPFLVPTLNWLQG